MYRVQPIAHRGLAAGVMLGILACSNTAHAETIEERDAKQRYNEGNELFTQGRYAEAVAKFRQAYAVWKSPVVTLGLGAATLKAGSALESLGYLRDYMEDTRVSEEGKKKAKPYFDEAYAKTGHLFVQAGAEGSATVDGAPARTAPREHDVEPGNHAVVCAAEASQPQQIAVRAGQRFEVRCAPAGSSLAPASQPAPGAAPPRRELWQPVAGRPVVMGVLGGLALASLGTGLATFLVGTSAKSDVDDASKTSAERDDARARVNQMRTVSTVTTWVGAGLAVATVVPLIVWPKKRVLEGALHVTPVVGAGHVGIAATF